MHGRPVKTSTSSVPAPVAPRLFTIPQAAGYLSATVWAVRSLIWAKELPNIRIGRRIVIPREALDAYVDTKLHENSHEWRMAARGM